MAIQQHHLLCGKRAVFEIRQSLYTQLQNLLYLLCYYLTTEPDQPLKDTTPSPPRKRSRSTSPTPLTTLFPAATPTPAVGQPSNATTGSDISALDIFLNETGAPQPVDLDEELFLDFLNLEPCDFDKLSK